MRRGAHCWCLRVICVCCANACVRCANATHTCLSQGALYGEAEPAALQTFSVHPCHSIIAESSAPFQARTGRFPHLQHPQTAFGPAVIHRMRTSAVRPPSRAFNQTCRDQGRMRTGVDLVSEANGGVTTWMRWRGAKSNLR